VVERSALGICREVRGARFPMMECELI